MRSILITDDSPEWRSILAIALRTIPDVHVLTAESAEQALDIAAGVRCGIAPALQARSDRPACNIPGVGLRSKRERQSLPQRIELANLFVRLGMPPKKGVPSHD